MKRHWRQRFLTLLVTVCSFALTIATPTIAKAQHGSGRLIIKRSPALGNDVFVDVGIDGARVGGILWGQRFSQPIPSGRHTIAVRLGPTAYSYWPSWLTLNVRPGATYKFMAVKRGGALVLAAAE